MLHKILNLRIAAAVAGLLSATLCRGAEPTLDDIAARLASYGCIGGTVRYEVSLPSSPDPVTYDIALQQGPGDVLAPASYIIEWTLSAGSGNKGFAAYGDGNHFRYRDLRLQEYHYEADSVPFSIGKGVQNQAQFVELLPAYLGAQLREMASDTTYVCCLSQSGDRLNLRGVNRVRGYDALEFDYVFDATTMLPERYSIVYNPASITEQEVTARFTWDKPGKADCPDVSETALIARYPGVFEKFRTSNFRVESMAGQALPEFTAPTLTGERYTYNRGRGFHTPTVIAFIDPEVETAAQTVAALRQAADMSASDLDIIYAFMSREADAVEPVMGYDGTRMGEYVLTGARSMFRDFGITACPTVLVCNRAGEVKQIITAYNKDLPTIVIQQTSVSD